MNMNIRFILGWLMIMVVFNIAITYFGLLTTLFILAGLYLVFTTRHL